MLQCIDGTSNKVSNIIRRHIDNRKLLLILFCYYHILSYSFRLYFLSIYGCIPVISVFLLLGLYILIVQLPWLRFFRAFSSAVRQMPGYNSPRGGTVRTLPKFLCCSMYCLFCIVLCVVNLTVAIPMCLKTGYKDYVSQTHLSIF